MKKDIVYKFIQSIRLVNDYELYVDARYLIN